MRLWTQARAMGEHAAHCMLADLRAATASQSQSRAQGEGQEWPPPAGLVPDTLTGFAFELFAHTTTFFGFKVIALLIFLYIN